MPELPEVESICLSLKSIIKNKNIIESKKLTNFSLRQKIPDDIGDKIESTKIIDVKRRSKYILIYLSNGVILIIHLGMSGKILIKDNNYVYQKHDHFCIILNDNIQIVYNDPRRFGLIFYAKEYELNKLDIIKNLGLEPLSLEFSLSSLEEKMIKKKQPIKLFLMDNKNIVGIGNIYASEILFLSKISPIRAVCSLNREEIKLLYYNIIKVLKKAIKEGGSTLKDYKHVNGESGYFQNFFNVYARENENCRMCNHKITRIKQAGRASFYCDSCQK